MITIILVVYKSDKKKLNKILKAIGTKYNLIIVDNSLNYNFDLIKLPKRTKIIRSINNGNGSGINIALKNCKTKFAIYFDIDVEFKKNLIHNLIKYSKKIKKFSILIPGHGKYKSGSLPVKDYVGEASVMFINMSILKKIGFFDENFFLYFEELDILSRCKEKKITAYLLPSLEIRHSRASSIRKSDKLDLLRAWHYMWSMFYFYKKNYSYFFAVKKTSHYIFKDLVVILISILLLNYKIIKFRFFRLFGITSSMLGLNSFLRP